MNSTPLRLAIALISLMLVACGGDSPSSPSATPTPTPAPAPAPAPAPIPAANLQASGQGSWTSCSPISGDCIWSGSLQNMGQGCATSTSVVVRLLDSGNAQVGSDIQVGAQGTSLSARTIRPGELVALGSLSYVSASVVSRTKTYKMFPTWTDARCP